MKKNISLLLIFIAFSIKAQIGINTTDPQETLHVVGSFRLENSGKGDKKVLTSDINGTGNWENLALPKTLGTITPSDVTFYSSDQTKRNLGAYITLSPGIWEVEVGIILDVGNTKNNSFSWVKLSFTDGGGSSINQSTDLTETNKLISGSVITIAEENGDQLPFYGFINGKVIINNRSDINKTYHLLYWGSIWKGSKRIISKLGSNIYKENFISAIRVQ